MGVKTREGTMTSNRQKPFFAEDFRVGRARQGGERKGRQTRQTQLGPAPPVTVDVHWDEILPTLNAVMDRVEALAQGSVAQTQAVQDAMTHQEQLMQHLLALQQQIVDANQQRLEGTLFPADNGTSTENTEEYLKYILQRVDASASAATTQVDLLQQQLSKLDDLQQQNWQVQSGATPTANQFDDMIALLGEIRERLGDLASGLPATMGEYVDRSREQLVDSLYSKLQEGQAGQANPTAQKGETPYSQLEQKPAGDSYKRARGIQPPSGLGYPPQSKAAAVSVPSNTLIDDLFAEEEAYLAEKKEYLNERADLLSRKKAWKLG
ncbi:MAG TPA: hypothetical protein VKK79_12955 [Candidatus Lokiarchaeia archaeon]|nr:hypothetical protein [Candidatus Lokiarchaeia archaeon]